ncbi:hypothetical protein HHK36_016135 [Tetracentron sinense]|uniref:Rab3 GTPase-activating protein catalytic subunit n=1 Tax=Tetracentron sinense TaxID=13715 RepID=A0A834Z082_TETSI|nr:hypothetical protein HHK36_016135 [Tetracentron sinense]
MASSSKIVDETLEGELEGFDDFTLASSWERFISEIEAVCRLWLADGPKNLLDKGAVHLCAPKNLYKVKFELKYVMKSYCMEYYFEINNNGKVADWNGDLHDLQFSFGVKEFLVCIQLRILHLVIAPLSASGVVLDAPEASKLLSAVAIALSNCGSKIVDETLEGELEGFDDFTLASSWERFISEIEAVCRLWLADGPKNLLDKGAVHLCAPKNLYKVKFELKYVMKSYCMEYYFEINNNGKVADWNGDLHDLQFSFGVKEFLVIAPLSASGVVLDAPEASKLLSAVAIALSNCGSMWPAFVPVHDPSRKAYIGIQNMGTVFTRRFEADHIGSQVPVRLMHLEGLYELFVSKFAFSTMDLSTHLFRVHFTMKLTYRTIPHDDDDNDIQGGDPEITGAGGNPEGDTHKRTHWDDDCPWTEWYSAEDPLKGFELITIWSNKMVESSLEMAELENASSHEAEKWLLFPILSPNLNDDSKRNTIGFASQLCLLVNALDTSFEAQFMEDFVSVENSGSDNLKSSTVLPPPTVLDRVLKDLFHEGAENGFPSLCSWVLFNVIDNYSIGVQVSDYAKGEHKNSRSIKGAPLESLFAQFCLHSLWFGNCNIRAIAMLWIEFVREVRWCWEESQPLPRMLTNGVIDLSTCVIHQKLQMLAICIEKKDQFNNDYQHNAESKYHASAHIKVEDSQVEEEVPTQMRISTEEFDVKRESPLTTTSTVPENIALSADLKPLDRIRRGSAGVVGSMMLLNSHQSMHAPFTQDAPLMTEDMHEERLRAVEAFGNSVSFSAQLERDILSSEKPKTQKGILYAYNSCIYACCCTDSELELEQIVPIEEEYLANEHIMWYLALGMNLCLSEMELEQIVPVEEEYLPCALDDLKLLLALRLNLSHLGCDMSAFKASNPNGVFEDFIRWHSPGDWENDAIEWSGGSRSHAMEGLKDDWPPRGKLSQRMSEHGNSWRQIWNDAPALPASEQKPLLDPKREGEKILHYLETVRPNQLLEQMVCTAFRASADSLNRTSFGGFRQMTTKIGQLYLTIASALKPFLANHLPDKGEIVDDLRQLCVVFEHVEKLLILAASMHRKLSQAPRISEAIFGDYYNFYLPRMGTGSVDSHGQMEFDLKQQVRMYERQVVANLFVAPTANQSWRKVLSMGNLLNGHEPILREIIFSMRDSMSGSHYRDHTPRSSSQEIETHRMYICGTSNDLRVALSVTSCD